jgi:hypothetical protein
MNMFLKAKTDGWLHTRIHITLISELHTQKSWLNLLTWKEQKALELAKEKHWNWKYRNVRKHENSAQENQLKNTKSLTRNNVKRNIAIIMQRWQLKFGQLMEATSHL